WARAESSGAGRFGLGRAPRPARAPVCDERLIGAFRLRPDLPLLIAPLFQVVPVRRSALSTPGRQPRPQLECPPFLRREQWATPRIILLRGEQLPGKDGQFARGRDGGDLLATPTADPQEECPQRAGCLRSDPRGLHEHPARVRTTLFRDAAVVGGLQARLSDAGIETEIAHQLLRRAKAGDGTDPGV